MKQLAPVFAIGLLALNTSAFAQECCFDNRPYIEIVGESEQWFTPDEIYINVVITEKKVDKVVVTVQTQEEEFKTNMRGIGIDISGLIVEPAKENHIRANWHNGDGITRKDYLLKVADSASVHTIFEKLEVLGHKKSYIKEVSHSNMDSLNQIVEVAAIQQAKRKADYLLEGIGETEEMAIIVRESAPAPAAADGGGGIGGDKAKKGKAIGGLLKNTARNSQIQYKRIKVKKYVYVRFLIKAK